VDEAETNHAETSLARAEFDLVRADIKQGEGALAMARRENSTKVAALLKTTDDLLTLIDRQLTKLKGANPGLLQFKTDVETFQAQLQAVPDALTEFETKIDELKSKEPEAKTKYVEAKRKSSERIGLSGLDSDLTLTGGDDGNETTGDQSVDGDGNEVSLDNAPPVTRGRTQSLTVNSRTEKPTVESIITAPWFRDLGKIRFPTDDNVDAWASDEDMQKSASDNRPDSTLRTYQENGRSAIDQFARLRTTLSELRLKKLDRREAIGQVRSLWVQLRALFDKPFSRTPNIDRSVKGWSNRQQTLAGDQSKFTAWKRANPGVVRTQERTAEVIRDDGAVVRAEEAHLNNIRR
jgi:hypothetical protein